PQTRPLLAGSPALGAGVALPGVTTDQRGVARSGRPDIGAYQAQVRLGDLSATQWTVGQSGYQASIQLSGATSYTNLSVSGLPAGLGAYLVGSTVRISGTPAAAGVFTVTVSVTRPGRTAHGGRPYTPTIKPA